MLSLSTNMIDTIVGLNGMQNLKILSLARNNIKSLSGLVSMVFSWNINGNGNIMSLGNARRYTGTVVDQLQHNRKNERY